MSAALNRVRALLEYAGNRQEPDALTARRIAARIAAEHGLDIQRLPRDERHDVRVESVSPGPEQWRHSLAAVVAAHTGVFVLRIGGTPDLEIVGRPEDLTRWRELYRRAEADVDAAALRWAAAPPEASPPSMFGRSRRAVDEEAFRLGAAVGFKKRLDEWRREAETSCCGVPAPADAALVLVSRDAAVADKVKELYGGTPRLENVRTSGSQLAQAAGMAAGYAMGVHRGLL